MHLPISSPDTSSSTLRKSASPLVVTDLTLRGCRKKKPGVLSVGTDYSSRNWPNGFPLASRSCFSSIASQTLLCRGPKIRESPLEGMKLSGSPSRRPEFLSLSFQAISSSCTQAWSSLQGSLWRVFHQPLRLEVKYLAPFVETISALVPMVLKGLSSNRLYPCDGKLEQSPRSPDQRSLG